MRPGESVSPVAQPPSFAADAPLESHRSRVLHLDGLRGLAAFAVVLDHYFGPMADAGGWQARIPWITGPGWLGVDVFFTLSGFLITGILLREPREPGYFKRFYGRRIFRLAPLYYVYLLVIALLEWRQHVLDVPNLLSDAVYLQDFYMARVGHWVTGTGLLWSLAIEEQFYLVWPAVVYRVAPRRLASIALTVGLLSLALRLGLLLSGYSFASYVLPFSHVDGMCLGALLALAARQTDPFRVRNFLQRARWPAALLLLALYIGCTNKDHSGTIFGTLAPVCVAVVTASLIARPGRWNALLVWSPARWLGRYSYAFYVLQFLPGVLLQRWLFAHTTHLVPRVAGLLGLIGLLAVEARLSWWLLEGPMLRLRERLLPDPAAPPVRAG